MLDKWRRSLSRLWGSPLGMVGVATTTGSAGLIIAAILIELLGSGLGPYQGLISFMFLPALFVAGLAMMPLGAWLRHRRERRAAAAGISVDLSDPRQLRFGLFVAVMTVFNMGILAVVSYEGYHYTESTAFCGTLCHSVMEPEYTAYRRSPHARVDCVECHIGSGASWFVKSKLSGLRQVVAVMTGDFNRPIPTPIDDLRPARETCEQCHWPAKFHGNRAKVFRRVPEGGDPSDPEVTVLVLRVGGLDERSGKYSGIHWHVSRDNRVEYRAVDRERTQIKEVRVVNPDGTRVLYTHPTFQTHPGSRRGGPWTVRTATIGHPTSLIARQRPWIAS